MEDLGFNASGGVQASAANIEENEKAIDDRDWKKSPHSHGLNEIAKTL
ncbi:MAG: hypothetical protein ABR568_23505 [Pyrinomonadaceae bacterium]